MSALDVLNRECVRRGWRLALTAVCPDGSYRPGARLATLEVHGTRRQDRRRLVSVPCGSTGELDQAAAACATRLKGLRRIQ